MPHQSVWAGPVDEDHELPICQWCGAEHPGLVDICWVCDHANTVCMLSQLDCEAYHVPQAAHEDPEAYLRLIWVDVAAAAASAPLEAPAEKVKLDVCMITQKEAFDFVTAIHRHHEKPQGWKWGIGLQDQAGKLRGVIVVGRPVARGNDDGKTLEVTRLCTDGVRNGCSKLYAAAWQAARAMGCKRMITYILASEHGVTLRAAGWKEVHKTRGGSWDSPSRPREDKHPTGPKTLWSVEVPTC